MGYLVCDKCKGYYTLQPGESPDDFSDKCECGGKLKYYEDDSTLEVAIDSSDSVGSKFSKNLVYYLFHTEPNLKGEMAIWGVSIGILALIELYFAVDIFLNIKGEPLMLILTFLFGISFLSLAVLTFLVSTKKIFWAYAGTVIGVLYQSLLLTDMSMSIVQIAIFFLPLIYFIRKAMS